MRLRTAQRAATAAAVLVLATTAAEAHLVETGLGPVYDGVAHLALSPEQYAPLAGAALYAGLRGKAAARFGILLTPAAWFAGSLAGARFGAAGFAAPAWATLLVVGGLTALDLRLPERALAASFVGLGLILGFGNGMATSESPQSFRAALGAGAAIFVVFALIASAASLASGWTRIAVRVVGSWIAASGLLALGWALR